MARSLPEENLLLQNGGQLSTTCSNILKLPDGELIVAVDHNKLRTMASETVDPIDWLQPHPHGQAVPPEPHVSPGAPGARTCVHGYSACAGTQGMSELQVWPYLDSVPV